MLWALRLLWMSVGISKRVILLAVVKMRGAIYAATTGGLRIEMEITRMAAVDGFRARRPVDRMMAWIAAFIWL